MRRLGLIIRIARRRARRGFLSGVRRSFRSDVVVDIGVLHINGGTLFDINAAATSTSVALDSAVLDGDAAVGNINAAACASACGVTLVLITVAHLSGLIVLDGAVVDGNILAVLDVNAAALFAFVFLDGQVLQQNAGVPSVLDGNAAFGGTGKWYRQ